MNNKLCWTITVLILGLAITSAGLVIWNGIGASSEGGQLDWETWIKSCPKCIFYEGAAGEKDLFSALATAAAFFPGITFAIIGILGSFGEGKGAMQVLLTKRFYLFPCKRNNLPVGPCVRPVNWITGWMLLCTILLSCSFFFLFLDSKAAPPFLYGISVAACILGTMALLLMAIAELVNLIRNSSNSR